MFEVIYTDKAKYWGDGYKAGEKGMVENSMIKYAFNQGFIEPVIRIIGKPEGVGFIPVDDVDLKKLLEEQNRQLKGNITTVEKAIRINELVIKKLEGKKSHERV